MLRERLDDIKYSKMIHNSKNFYYEDYVSHKLYKLDKNCAINKIDNKLSSRFISKIDDEQINWLNSLNSVVNNSDLPIGVAYYSSTGSLIPVAVIYDSIFLSYKSFNNLSKENDDLIFNNLRKAVNNNMELLKYGINNVGFSFNNIVYKNKNVKLINLDGYNIKNESNNDEVYKRFLNDLEQLFIYKLSQYYTMDEVKDIYQEYKYMFSDYTSNMSNDYPMVVIDEMQRKLLLK